MKHDNSTFKLATTLGYTVTTTRGGHLRFTHPQIHHPIFTASTPSDRRGVLNLRADLKRALRHAQTPETTTQTTQTQAERQR